MKGSMLAVFVCFAAACVPARVMVMPEIVQAAVDHEYEQVSKGYADAPTIVLRVDDSEACWAACYRFATHEIIVNPVLLQRATLEDVRFILGHEFGHWYCAETQGLDQSTLWTGEPLTKEEYRKLPVEACADRFALQFVSPDYNILKRLDVLTRLLNP